MNPNAYLLIAVIDRAHERARNINFMLDMAEIAENFRSKASEAPADMPKDTFAKYLH